MTALTRRALLRQNPDNAPRLPWLTPDWSSRCTRCGDCLPACEEAILVVADGGFPAIDFNRGGCTGCGACAEACEAGVFDPGPALWPHAIAIDDRCLTHSGVFCQSCRDSCDANAIRFALDRPVPVPALDPDACTACGLCLSNCPADAITWRAPA